MKVFCLTGSRADYASVSAVHRWLAADPRFTSTLWGLWRAPDAGQVTDIGARETASIPDRMASAMTFAASMMTRKPDIVLLDGDRWEIAAAALAINQARVPIAHLSGGDVTMGSQDDQYRDAITKLSHLHFVANVQALDRVINHLGERGDRVHLVGSPAVDIIMANGKQQADPWETIFGRASTCRILVNFQAATLADDPAYDREQFFTGLRTFARKYPDALFVCAFPGVEPGSREIADDIKDFALRYAKRVMWGVYSLRTYLDLMHDATMLVGNSSSAYYEAPCFGTPCVDFKFRQRGRIPHARMVHAGDATSLAVAMENILNLTIDRHPILNPYGDGHAREKIATQLAACLPQHLVKK